MLLIKKYYRIAKIYVARLLVFRLRMVIWTLNDAVAIFVLPLVWLAAFGDKTQIQGLTKPELVTYYIVLGIVFILATPHPEEHMNQEIKDGKVSIWLVRPFSYFKNYLMSDALYRLVQAIVVLLLVPLVFFFYRDYLIFTNITSLFLAIVAGSIGFLIFFQLSFALGCAAFWLDDAYGVHNLYWFYTLVFGGALVPLEFLPKVLQSIAAVLPFRYFHYFPVKLYLNQLTTPEIIQGFMVQLLWFALAFVIYKTVWALGTKRYSAVGG